MYFFHLPVTYIYGYVGGCELLHNQRRIHHQLIDLFGLYVLFSQYRSCDNTQEVWSFVLFIKMRACKHEYACMPLCWSYLSGVDRQRHKAITLLVSIPFKVNMTITARCLAASPTTEYRATFEGLSLSQVARRLVSHTQ